MALGGEGERGTIGWAPYDRRRVKAVHAATISKRLTVATVIERLSGIVGGWARIRIGGR